MRAVPSSFAVVLGLLGLGAGLAPEAPPPPVAPATLGEEVAALEAAGPSPWYDGGPRARFEEGLQLLTRIERELDAAATPLGDAWARGLAGARAGREARLGAWMARVQAVLATIPDPAWQARRHQDPAWTAPARPRRVASPTGVAAALSLIAPAGDVGEVHEVAWIGNGQVLLSGPGGAWLGRVGEPARRLALPPAVQAVEGLLGAYARAPWEIALAAREGDRPVALLVRLDERGGPRVLGTVPLEGTCGTRGLRLRREAGDRLEVLRDCGGERPERALWTLERGRYRPPGATRGSGFRVVLRG